MFTLPKISTYQLQTEIEAWISKSQSVFQDYVENQKAWIIKYCHPNTLRAFNKVHIMPISNRPGYTWGTGIYVTPLKYPRSTMTYGKVGIVGYLETSGLRVYNALEDDGLALFQAWASVFERTTYLKAGTRVNPETYLHKLRNSFRHKFNIHVVFFRPDEYNKTYIDQHNHVWFLVSDRKWIGSSPAINDCRWVVVVGEEFEADKRFRYARHDLIGPHVRDVFPSLNWGSKRHDSDITNEIISAYYRQDLIFLEP